MKKKYYNKGFTLTEILAVIIIVSTLLLLITPTIINKVSQNKDKTKESQLELIKEATNQFTSADPNTYPNIKDSVYCIPLQDLIDKGFLNDNIKDVTTNEKFPANTTIKETIDSKGNKNYEISDDSCKENHKSSNITFSISPSNNVWSQSKTVIINYPDLKGYGKQFQTYLMSSPEVTDSFNKSVKFDKDLDEEGKNIVAFLTKNGQTTLTATQVVKRIDTEKPEINLTINENPTHTLNIDYNMTATDKLSGISKYCITTSSKCNPNKPYNQNGIQETDKDILGFESYDGSTKNLTACAIDKAGNTNCQTKSYTVKKDDYIPCNGEKTETTTYSAWSGYGSCSKSCGTGKQTRTRVATTTVKDKKTGKVCSTNKKTESDSRSCNTQSCCSKVSKSYGSWSSCKDGKKKRTVTQKSAYNGQSCGKETETKTCSCSTTCKIRGNSKKSGASWTCNHGHKQNKHYQIYCRDKKCNIKPKTSSPTWACTVKPYGKSDGWKIIDD